MHHGAFQFLREFRLKRLGKNVGLNRSDRTPALANLLDRK